MKIFSKLTELFKKKPQAPVHQSIPGYNYWHYREDLFNPQLSFDDIMIRSGGTIPRPSRMPKVGEIWEYQGCKKHGAPPYNYPLRVAIVLEKLPEYLMSFVICGCLVLVEEKKVGS